LFFLKNVFFFPGCVLRARESCPEQIIAMKEASRNNKLDEVLSGLDVLGQTPWRINSRVFQVQLQIWEQGGGRGTIPEVLDTPVPPKPENFDSLSPKEKREFLQLRSKITKKNKELHSLRCDANYKFEIAKTVSSSLPFFLLLLSLSNH